MLFLNFPEDENMAIRAQQRGIAYVLTAKCEICGQEIMEEACIYGYKPRCEDHILTDDGVAFLEMRTAPFESIVVLNPNKEPRCDMVGESVPNLPTDWIYLGCPVFLRRMNCESDVEFLARAQKEANEYWQDPGYQQIDW